MRSEDTMKNKTYCINRIEKLKPNAPIYCRRLAKLMESSNCSNLALAKAVDVSEGQISNILYKDGYTPNFVTMCKIAKYFNVPVDYLAGQTTEKSLDMSIQKISNITGLYEGEINLLKWLKQESKNTVDKIISDDVTTAIHALLGDKHLLEIIGAYLTADYESEHGAAMEVSKVLIAYNKNSNKNEAIDCEYLPFVFLKAIEDKLGKIREKMLQTKSSK